ncbi:hypothetical protein M406DRAFT_329424 [Cryphonectria parasitica EP155]|uniref:Uncharacterized protein n=1 Tax=Cryphonectria parasitica (strain ATCC 38755 / EP155) TaxID=660469 RepID=A0A9P4Y2M6_CRYP1|nr:uncharacterized protein M406DRAFT_329424 [Cryphonectria parasitica EP155]KAF3765523.1 hypothetical protein M406DRAFT_329424 [Cryphonectria parasitica EP155]
MSLLAHTRLLVSCGVANRLLLHLLLWILPSWLPSVSDDLYAGPKYAEHEAEMSKPCPLTTPGSGHRTEGGGGGGFVAVPFHGDVAKADLGLGLQQQQDRQRDDNGNNGNNTGNNDIHSNVNVIAPGRTARGCEEVAVREGVEREVVLAPSAMTLPWKWQAAKRRVLQVKSLLDESEEGGEEDGGGGLASSLGKDEEDRVKRAGDGENDSQEEHGDSCGCIHSE